MHWALAIVALTLLGVAAVSRRLAGTPITPAIVFVVVGLLAGPKVLDGIDVESSSGTVRSLAEATLALVLFCDASRIDLGQLRRAVDVPLRLLGIGLPLTIALGALAAAAILGALTVEEAVILAVVLAPTDAALGQAVVTEPRIPAPDPPGTQRRERAQRRNLRAAAVRRRRGRRRRIARSPTGAAPRRCCSRRSATASSAASSAASRSRRSSSTPAAADLIDAAWRQVIPAAGAALAYGTAIALGGSGFIAAFVAGMTFRLALRRDPGRHQRAQRAGRATCSTASPSCCSERSCSAPRSAS